MHSRSPGLVMPKPPTSFSDLSLKYTSFVQAVGLNLKTGFRGLFVIFILSPQA
jgi:hypothetical protein